VSIELRIQVGTLDTWQECILRKAIITEQWYGTESDQSQICLHLQSTNCASRERERQGVYQPDESSLLRNLQTQSPSKKGRGNSGFLPSGKIHPCTSQQNLPESTQSLFPPYFMAIFTFASSQLLHRLVTAARMPLLMLTATKDENEKLFIRSV